MASQVNSQYAYINLINGETVWERLRIVRNFIEDRKIAKKLQTTQDKKRLGFLAKIDEAKSLSEKIFAEVELEEFDAHKEQQEDGYKKLDDELAFLLKYESELAKIAEETRVLDKTDDEMYQINMGTEVIMRNMRKIETERVASMIGCSLATAEESMRIPEMHHRMINTANALSLPITEETAQIRMELMQNGLDFDNMPLSVQEELKLNQILLLGK
jgi:transcription elongation GreA/GreB family factor